MNGRGDNTDEKVALARDLAVQEVLRRHHLFGRKFHNQDVVREVAHEVAAAVAALLGTDRSR